MGSFSIGIDVGAAGISASGTAGLSGVEAGPSGGAVDSIEALGVGSAGGTDGEEIALRSNLALDESRSVIP
ncbi:MAG TPA: hypothetical protein VJH69_03840 [Candidatus Paceibacterota bacterium]